MKNTEAGKATRRVQLKNMPFDRFEDGVGFIHATGIVGRSTYRTSSVSDNNIIPQRKEKDMKKQSIF